MLQEEYKDRVEPEDKFRLCYMLCNFEQVPETPLNLSHFSCKMRIVIISNVWRKHNHEKTLSMLLALEARALEMTENINIRSYNREKKACTVTGRPSNKS